MLCRHARMICTSHIEPPASPPSLLGLSLMVLFLLISRVTVDGLTPAALAIDLQDSPLYAPSSIATLLSLSMCFFFPSLMVTPFRQGPSNKKDGKGKVPVRAGRAPHRTGTASFACKTTCNTVAIQISTHQSIRRNAYDQYRYTCL